MVDRTSHEIVGILAGIATDRESVALAVPTRSLADFLGKVQPGLAQRIFPARQAVLPDSPDLYPPMPASHPESTLHARADEPATIKLLRERAQQLADSMANFLAVQTLEWGVGSKPPAATAAYETRILDGYQRFRKYPDGTKDLKSIPFPPLNTTIVPGGEWSELPELLGKELHLRIEQMPDSAMNGHPIQVFRFRAAPEDSVCRWRSTIDFGFFSTSRDVTVGCFGEVWTDPSTNILRMTEHYELPGKWKNYAATMIYGWLQRSGESRRLIPLSISSRAEYHGKVYWCRSNFVKYRVFTSEVRMTMDRPDVGRP